LELLKYYTTQKIVLTPWKEEEARGLEQEKGKRRHQTAPIGQHKVIITPVLTHSPLFPQGVVVTPLSSFVPLIPLSDV